MKKKHTKEADASLSGLDDPDGYLDTLIDELFVQKVKTDIHVISEHLEKLDKAVTSSRQKVLDSTSRLVDDIKKKWGDKNVQTLLDSIQEMRTDGTEIGNRIEEFLSEAVTASRERDEATHKAVSGVLKRLTILGEDEGKRDKFAAKVANAIHKDVEQVKVTLEADVRSSLDVISQAVETFVTEEASRAQATSREFERLHRWTLAATLAASAALIAAVLAVIL